VKKDYAQGFSGSKIYFTEGDASSQQNYNISLNELDIKLKYWLLFADHVILSTGHMLESPLTFHWLERSKGITGLARDFAILPSLREDRDGFKSYLLQAPEQEDKPSLLRAKKNILFERAEILDDIFDMAITWSPKEESRWFRNSMCTNLEDKNSPLRKRLKGIPNNALEGLTNDISECEFLTRENLWNLIKKHCPSRFRILSRYGDIFYYLSGAHHKDAYPVLHDEASGISREEISYEAKNTGCLDFDMDFWKVLINAWDISAVLLKDVPLELIASIRNDALGKRVRKKWKKLIDKASESSSLIEPLSEFAETTNKMTDLLMQEMSLQKHTYRTIRKGRKAIEGINWITSGITTLAAFILSNNIQISSDCGVLSFMLGKKILDYAESKIPGIELTLLATRIKEIKRT